MRAFDDPHDIAGADDTRLKHAVVPAGPVRFLCATGHGDLLEPVIELEARLPGLRDLKHHCANLDDVAYAHVVLVKAFGDTPPYAIFSDSLEAYGADWTPTLPAEFQKRRGYDLLPHLPELVAGGTPAAEKIRHDWGQTLTELVNENYLTQINNWAIAHHTKFRSQTYGEPAVSFSSQRLAALPEGEGPQWRAFSTLRWATSANHVFGNNVTSGETFTWLHSPVFRATPLDMKAEADIDFIMGENQLIFHGWPYSPPPGKVPEPGWSLYAAAVFNDHNPWHPVMPDVTRYIQRISYLLRQGQPANQVAILLPTDDAWASFTPAHVTVTGAIQKLITPALMSAILSAGYNVDYIDAEAINSIGLGTHQILILPPTDRIPADTLKKIVDWSAYGGAPENNHYSALAQINRNNVKRLAVAWSFDTEEAGVLQSSPIVVAGVLYGLTPTQKVFALDAATGRLLWKFDSGIRGTQPDRGLAYWADGKDKRILGVRACRLGLGLTPLVQLLQEHRVLLGELIEGKEHILAQRWLMDISRRQARVVAQFGQRVRHGALDRPDRAVQHLSYLSLGKVVEYPQHEHSPLPIGQ